MIKGSYHMTLLSLIQVLHEVFFQLCRWSQRLHRTPCYNCLWCKQNTDLGHGGLHGAPHMLLAFTPAWLLPNFISDTSALLGRYAWGHTYGCTYVWWTSGWWGNWDYELHLSCSTDTGKLILTGPIYTSVWAQDVLMFSTCIYTMTKFVGV